MKTETRLNIAIIIFGIFSMLQGWLEFLVGNVQFPLYMSLFFFFAFILGWAIKNRFFPYIFRPNLDYKLLLITCCSWLIIIIFELMAGGANIRVDYLVTLPLVIILSSTSILRLLFGLFGKSHDKALQTDAAKPRR